MALQHAQSGAVIDLLTPAGDVESQQTRALVKSDTFEAIHLKVAKGKQIPAHQIAGKFTLLCLTGSVIIGLDERDVELAPGQWVYFDGGIRHSVSAIDHSSLLLTIIF
jgi:quercetin dioxygenase-like cupin family protein